MCSYCGCQDISVIGRFMAEHVEIINATGDLRRACEAGDAALVRQTADAVAALLGPHVGSEERGLFTVMAEQDEFTEHIRILCGEHGSLDRVLEAVAAGDFALVTTFEAALRAHIDKEDNGLFPAAAIAMSGPDWERIVELEGGDGHDHAHDHDHPHEHGDHHHEHGDHPHSH